MSDEIKHECAVAMVVFRKPPSATGDFGGTKLSLMLEKQHNRGQDGAGAAILSDNPEPGTRPYWISKSASVTALADVLGAIARRDKNVKLCNYENMQIPNGQSLGASTIAHSRVFLGHLRYATFGKNDVAFCHPFVHESSDLAHTLLLAGNFNLTNTAELFEDYSTHGSFPTSKADGYLICELVAKALMERFDVAAALSKALANADGAWTLCGMTGDGWAFATRDPHGIRPGYYYLDDNVVAVASERPAIQAAFDVPPDAVKELPPGSALVVSPEGEVECCQYGNVANANSQCQLEIGNIGTGNIGNATPRPCAFERIYFSRANDADIHRERKALGAALIPQILEAADAPLEDVFFSYIPNSARIAFHGLLEKLLEMELPQRLIPRFGEVAVKDAKFRTFIADAAARREFYKHVYDVTYGLVRPGKDTLVVLDDSIVRGNTMKNAILPMLDRLGPKRIVVASSAPPIRYPDCYGIDMSTLGELVAFRALVNLLDGERGTGNGERELRRAFDSGAQNPLAALYARFPEEEHAAEIARLLTPPDMKAEVVVVYQTIDALRECLAPADSKTRKPENPRPRRLENSKTRKPENSKTVGDWYFTGEYPTPGGYKVLRHALANYLDRKTERSY